MKWIELSCRVDREAVESVAELFARLGRGVVIEDDRFLDGEETSRPAPWVTMRTYLAQDADAPDRQSEIQLGLWVLGLLRPVGELETRLLAEEDWANAWKDHFHVHRVGERVVIKPSWRAYEPAPGEVVVELDPGMAFGTGLHPTTQLCLEALERAVEPGQAVLDLGTGSAILAIAAAKLGAARVSAVDTDSVAVEVAQANVAANDLAGKVKVLRGTLPLAEPAPTFDLVVANIIANVIRDLAPALREALAPGGLLIAGGILAEREEEVAAALAATGLAVVDRRRAGDWSALVAKR